MKEIIKKLGKDWMKFWAFKYSLLGATMLGSYYPEMMEKQMGKGYKHVVLISRKGHTSCYLKIEERKEFGLHQIKKYVKPEGVKEFCNFLKEKTDEILSLLNFFKEKGLSEKEFEKFVEKVQVYLGYYTAPRQIIDHIGDEKINLVLEDLRQARLHAEPVFGMVEEVIQGFCKQLTAKTKYEQDILSSMTIEEMREYLKSGKLASKAELKKRYEHSSVVIAPKTHLIFDDEDTVNELEKLNVESEEEGVVKGTTAFKGKVRGTVRIIFDPAKVSVFNEGDVLVTGMTRPDYLQLMKKASAIVTDIGGLLCHAAIVAREIGKPCVIGTQKATKVFKDGDVVEVDAERGIVKKIK